MSETKQQSGLPLRLAETNSCYSGGKQGVSDTFASALWNEGAIKAAIFNKHQDRSVQLTIDPGERFQAATVLRLAAPALDSTHEVTLGGAEVDNHGGWAALHEEGLTADKNKAILELPAGSAALVTFVKK